MELTAQVLAVRRRRNTTSGNPRFEVTTNNGMYRTADDSQVNTTVAWELAAERKDTMRLTLDGWAKITHAEQLVEGDGKLGVTL